MKKILLAMAVLFGCITMSFAQTSFIATLQHEGEFTHYYGAGALTSAYNAAEAGDIITLSPGTFTSPGTINKSITLRGTGMEATEKTYVSGNTTFASTDETMVTTVEGICFASTSIQNNSAGSGQGTIKLIKNTFNGLNATVANNYSNDRGPIVRIYNCSIYNGIRFNGNTYPDFIIYNSYVEDPGWQYNTTATETTSTFVNCVIRWRNDNYHNYDHYSYAETSYYLNYYNCIFIKAFANNNTRESSLPSTATCYNCLGIYQSILFNNLVSGDGNRYDNSGVSEVFTTFNGNKEEGEIFELTAAAQEAYIGTDGTQIGMQGGYYPYNTTPQYPIITKFNADPQTNKTGMLNVEVEVDGE